MAARAVAQPGGQLAKASEPRRVRASSRPGATGSTGNAGARDVVLVVVRNPLYRSRYLSSVGFSRHPCAISPSFNDRLAFLTIATD